MALRKRTDNYWKKRSEQRLKISERQTKAYMVELRKVYSEARRNTIKQLQDIYAAYYKKDEGFDKQALRSIVSDGELRKFMTDMERLGLKTNLPKNYQGRVSRLRYLNAQMEAEVQKAGLKEQRIDTEALRNIYTDSYYRAGFDVAKGIGSTPNSFSTLDTQTVEQVMNAKFQGRNFSKRIWNNTDILAGRLKGDLATAIANGQSIQKTAADFRHRFGVQQYYAERLIRTESNHFHNSGELESYKAMGFDQFRYVATLDNRTSEICQELDGKIFKVSEGVPGENVPPAHVNCRSTIVPYFKDYEPETRLYRDPKTGKNQYTYNMGYRDWVLSLGRPDLNSTNSPTVGIEKGVYKIIDRTQKILEQAKPKTGSIKKAPNYDEISISKLGKTEQENAVWLKNTLGGNIQHLPSLADIKQPDYKWNNTKLELKTISTKNIDSFSHIIKRGSKQIERKGGLLLDMTNAQELLSDAISLKRRITTDMYRFNIDFIIIRNGDKLHKYYAKVKRKNK